MIAIHPIHDDEDHARAMSHAEQLWGAPAGTPEADTLDVLVALIDAYEAKHLAIDPPDPIGVLGPREDVERHAQRRGLR